MARGGKRRGTPGKAYSNRTDLGQNYNPSQGAVSPASGGLPVPNQHGTTSAPAQAPEPPAPNWMSPDDVPTLRDPTARPQESVLAGLGEQVPLPAPSYLNTLYAAYLASPTPELRRALNYLTQLDS